MWENVSSAVFTSQITTTVLPLHTHFILVLLSVCLDLHADVSHIKKYEAICQSKQAFVLMICDLDFLIKGIQRDAGEVETK